MDATPETRFAQSGGLSIAYQVVGDGPIDLAFVPGFMSHVELNWDYAFYRSVLEPLTEFARLIVLDKRGTGLSDRSLGLGTFEEHMDDVRAVMDAAGSERAALIGVSEGGAVCALMAATYPERVSALVLMAAACPGLFDLDILPGLLDFIGDRWSTGRVLAIFVQHPPDPEAAQRALARFERHCCTPAVAVEIMRRNLESDIRHVLPSVTVPTLVVHVRDDPLVPFSHGEYFADHIPGATMVAIEGDFHGRWRPADHVPIIRAARQFLTGEVDLAVAGPIARVLSTVLFTDIADSTIQAGELGLATRAGAHTGEIELRGDDVSGIAVHIASPVATLAGAGEVLVSRTVKDLSAGSGIAFDDRGEHGLQGVPDSWHLFAASV